jgi:CheY-like chemotaxis protein
MTATKKRVLLVDDSKTILMMERMLLGSEFEVRDAADGEQALREALVDPPDIMLLDLVMPKLDGIETLKHLRANACTRNIPVIMVTTKGEDGRAEAALAAGCQAFVTKPIHGPQLLTKIRALLGE